FRSSAANPALEHTAISPFVRAFAQLKLGCVPAGTAGAGGLAVRCSGLCTGAWGDTAGGCSVATPFVSTDAVGAGAGAPCAGAAWPARARVASGAITA